MSHNPFSGSNPLLTYPLTPQVTFVCHNPDCKKVVHVDLWSQKSKEIQTFGFGRCVECDERAKEARLENSTTP